MMMTVAFTRSRSYIISSLFIECYMKIFTKANYKSCQCEETITTLKKRYNDVEICVSICGCF